MQVKTIVGVAMLAALAAPEAYAQTTTAIGRPRPNGWTPSVTVMESYTDNVALTPTNRKSDFITDVSFGIDGNYAGPRLEGSLNASAGYNFFANTSDLNGFNFRGFGTGVYSVVPNTLTIEANGLVQNRTVSAYRQSAIDRTTPQDRIQVGVFSAGPHLTTPVGNVVDLDLSALANAVNYRTADSSTTTFVPDDSTFVDVKGLLATGDRLDRLELELTGAYLADNHDFTEASGYGTAYYAVTPITRLFVRAGQDNIEQKNIIDISATMWSVGAQFKFNQGSHLNIEGGRRYGRPSYNLDALIQVSQRLQLTAIYREQLQPPQISLGRSLTDRVVLPVNPITGALDEPLVFGDIIYETSFEKQAQAHLIYLWPQQSIDFAVGWADQELLQSKTTARSYSTFVTYRHEIRVDLVAELLARYYRTEANALFGAARSYGGEASLIYALRPTTQIRLGYAFIDDKRLFAGREHITENVLSIALRKQF